MRSKGGVVIPNETVADSERKKQSKRKTLSQLPVYRDASRLKYVAVLLVLKGAKKLGGFYDDLLHETYSNGETTLVIDEQNGILTAIFERNGKDPRKTDTDSDDQA